MTKKFLAIAVALATLAACSDGTLKDESTTAGGTGNGGDGDGGTPEGTTVIVKEVTATVGEYASRMNGTEWEVGDEIAVVCTSDETKGLKKYTYNEESEKVTGAFVNEEGFELEDGESATFNVYYPYYDEGDVIYASTDDQSITGHNSIDFLYVGDVTTDGETLEATLEHTMCQLTLDFIYDETSAFSSEDIESITIKNVILDGYFDPTTGETVAEGTATDLTISYEEFCENVILYPQSFADGIEIVVTLKEDAAEYSMTLELSEGELSHGLSYEYDITVSEEGIESNDNPEGDEEWNDDDDSGNEDGDGDGDGDGDENPDDEEPGPAIVYTVAGTYDKVYNHCVEWDDDNNDVDINQTEQLAFYSTIYTVEEVLEELSSTTLKTNVEESGAGYAILNEENGVFLFNVDDDDNFTAVAWYQADGSLTFPSVSFSNTIVHNNDAGEYDYVKMVIDVTYDGSTLWKVYTREYSMSDYIEEKEYTTNITENAVTITYTTSTSSGGGPGGSSGSTTYTYSTATYTMSTSTQEKIAKIMNIPSYTHDNVKGSGWYPAICSSATELHNDGEYGWERTNSTAVGWYVGSDGYYTSTTTNVLYVEGNHDGTGNTDIIILTPLTFGVAVSSSQGGGPNQGSSGSTTLLSDTTVHLAFADGETGHVIYIDIPVTFQSSSSGSGQGPN